MKPHVTMFLFLLCPLLYAGDATVAGGMSGSLALTLAFEGGTKQFVMTLRNTSTNSLKLEVQPTTFHGSIVVARNGRRPQTYYEKRFKMLRATSEWTNPKQEVPPGASIIWKLAVSEVCDVYDNPITLPELNGASVYAELNELAIVPPDGNYILSNARQKSARIKVRVEPDGEASRNQPDRSETNQPSAVAGSGR